MGTTERHGVLITPDAAQAVLWHFGDPAGIQPGSFTESLLATISKADLENRAALLGAFPELVSAFIAGQREHDGIEMLRQVAMLREHDCEDCNGIGQIVFRSPVDSAYDDWDECETCNGTGTVLA